MFLSVLPAGVINETMITVNCYRCTATNWTKLVKSGDKLGDFMVANSATTMQ